MTRRDMIEVTRRIAADAETVFGYLTDSVKFARWFGVDAELDARPGGRFRATVTGKTHMVASGEFIEVDPPVRVVYTWGWEPVDGVHPGLTEVPPGTSRVEIHLTPDGDSTIVRLRHSGLPTPAACEFHESGWGITLDRLVVVATGRDPGPSILADV